MIKKIFTLCIVAATAVSANALDILSSFGSTKWNSSYDEATKTVTFTDTWGGCGWWVDGADYSVYATLDITIEPSTLDLNLTVSYDHDGTDTESQNFPAGATNLSIALNPEKSAHVYSMYITCGELTDSPTATLTSAVLTPQSGGESVTVYEGSFDLGNWDQQLDLPITKFVTAEKDSKLTITYTLNEGQEYGAISLVWIDNDWNWVTMTSMSSCPGYNEDGYIETTASGEFVITLNETDVNNLVNVGGQEVVIKGAYLTISKIELSNTASGIAPLVVNDDENAAPEYFDMQGRRVINPATGHLYIVRRGTSVAKQILR